MTRDMTIAHEEYHRSAPVQNDQWPAHRHGRTREAERAQPTDIADRCAEVATMNSTVELRDLETGEIEVYTLVYPDQADVTQNRISLQAPVGAAMYGCRVGDIVSVTAPSGPRRLRLEAVRLEQEQVT